MSLSRFFYTSTIHEFLKESNDSVFGKIATNSGFSDMVTQKKAWKFEIEHLKNSIEQFEGQVIFEFSIPRMGKRIDVLLIIQGIIFILEYKVGSGKVHSIDKDQVMDYALDLKNFHKDSHDRFVVPVLIATDIEKEEFSLAEVAGYRGLLQPIAIGHQSLESFIGTVLSNFDRVPFDIEAWLESSYSPTPTIIEAATALFNNHHVEEITRNDALAKNLGKTRSTVQNVITRSRRDKIKSICFVTGVPGAGKTLVGLDIANSNLNSEAKSSSVFLSGNGPLVSVLREALARDNQQRAKEDGKPIKKGEAFSKVKVFIQNVHHYRDEYLKDSKAPADHVAIFDEAQRAWNREQTIKFMKEKKNQPDFGSSEPEFLISCLDRHQDWAVIICLVGGGQEINTGEAGIAEWIQALKNSFPDWNVFVSDRLSETEYNCEESLSELAVGSNVKILPELHLAVSIRSFRSEKVSGFVKSVLDLEVETAKKQYSELADQYPLVITRDVEKAKGWLRSQAKGTQRYGIVVSSNAERLKPLAMDVRSPMNPVHWFLNDKSDVRSSYYLESVATEFHVQGLELDWACVTWDGDFRFADCSWQNWSFRGSKWTRIRKQDRQLYQKNAYRVLLTRARQGMVILVPRGDSEDPTRLPEYYDSTYDYLRKCGVRELN